MTDTPAAPTRTLGYLVPTMLSLVRFNQFLNNIKSQAMAAQQATVSVDEPKATLI